MHHDVAVRHQLIHQCGIGDIADNQAALYALEVRPVTRVGEFVQHRDGDFWARGSDQADEVGADESGAASN